MGNREALMLAAKRCLNERGYSQTSARDIASEAGVSKAAIGYHYGTKDALLMEALLEALGEWGAALGEKLVAPTAPGTTAGDRFTQNWERVIPTFATDRALWRIQPCARRSDPSTRTARPGSHWSRCSATRAAPTHRPTTRPSDSAASTRRCSPVSRPSTCSTPRPR